MTKVMQFLVAMTPGIMLGITIIDFAEPRFQRLAVRSTGATLAVLVLAACIYVLLDKPSD